MEPQRLEYLLQRYATDTCTAQELSELNDWFHSVNYGSADFQALIAESGGKGVLAENLYSDFELRNNPERKPRRLAAFIRIAAAIILVMVAGAAFYLSRAPQPVAKQQGPIKPGGNKAILTLANGTKLTLDGAANGKLANEIGVTISKTANGELLYRDSQQDAPAVEEAVYNTIDIPRGGQYQLVLPDGSKVWLNAASSLRYPVRFAASERRVYLSGEAYFEVAHDAGHPFIVASGKQEIKVLGTHFNVKAYDDENTIKTTLLEGSVLVNAGLQASPVLLKPGQQASLAKGATVIKVYQANADEVIAWKSGYFLFDNQDIRSIMRMISRWYNVDIRYDKINTAERFGGTFSRSRDLQEILTNLEKLGKTRFKIQERSIIVSN